MTCGHTHQIRAAELNPSDPFNLYGVGQWYDIVAGLGYAKRKLAAWAFGSEIKVRGRRRYAMAFRCGHDAWPRVSHCAGHIRRGVRVLQESGAHLCVVPAPCGMPSMLTVHHARRLCVPAPRFWVRNALKLATVCANLKRVDEGKRYLQQVRAPAHATAAPPLTRAVCHRPRTCGQQVWSGSKTTQTS